tara:strand:- start:151 stop:438 length:288 start_codon:yes stop_codon:yes gene_type:complete
MQNICYICHDENNEFSIRLKCNHIYHEQCIKESIKLTGPECPYCRDYVNLRTLKKLIKPVICKAIIKSGPKKGQQCSFKAAVNNEGYCKKHRKPT